MENRSWRAAFYAKGNEQKERRKNNQAEDCQQIIHDELDSVIGTGQANFIYKNQRNIGKFVYGHACCKNLVQAGGHANIDLFRDPVGSKNIEQIITSRKRTRGQYYLTNIEVLDNLT